MSAPELTDDQARKALLAITVHDDLMAINAELQEAHIKACEDRNNLRSINAELLEALKHTEAALLEGAEQYVIPVIRSAIAKAEGRK